MRFNWFWIIFAAAFLLSGVRIRRGEFLPRNTGEKIGALIMVIFLLGILGLLGFVAWSNLR